MDGMSEKRIYGPSKIVFVITSGLTQGVGRVFICNFCRILTVEELRVVTTYVSGKFFP